MIIKVDIKTKSVKGVLRFSANENRIKSIVHDSRNGFLYVSTFTSPTFIVKIRTLDFLRVDSFLARSVDSISSGVFDAKTNTVYFATYSAPAMIIKFNAKKFSIADTLSLDDGQNKAYSLLHDEKNNALLMGTFTKPARVVRIQLSNFTATDELVLPTTFSSISAGVLDQTYRRALYGSWDTGSIAEVHLDSFTLGANYSLVGAKHVYDMAIDPVSDYLFVTSSSADVSSLHLLSLETMKVLQEFQVKGEKLRAVAVDFDSRTALVGATNSPSLYSLAYRVSCESGSCICTSGAADSCFWDNAQIREEMTSNLPASFFSSVGVFGSSAPRSNFLYVASATSPTEIAKLRLSDLSVQDSMHLLPEVDFDGQQMIESEGFATTALGDSNGDFGYVSTATQPPSSFKFHSDHSHALQLSISMISQKRLSVEIF